jgi:hypothetical protein
MVKKVQPERLLEILATANPHYEIHVDYDGYHTIKIWISDNPYYIYILELENQEIINQYYHEIMEIIKQHRQEEKL